MGKISPRICHSYYCLWANSCGKFVCNCDCQFGNSYGKGSLTITGFININKDFMDGGDLNIGNSGTVSCGMEVKFKLDF